MDAGSDPAFEVMAQPQQGQGAPEGIGTVGFPQKAVPPHLMLCVLAALFSAFLFPDSSSPQLFPAVPGVR